MDSHDYIGVRDASEHNLKHLSLKIPKRKIVLFTGISGSGKSSLVFDTIAAQSRRELHETFPSFVQHLLPRYDRPEVAALENLPVTILIDQKPVGANIRSTVGTYTDAHALLRLLYSRMGKPFVGYSDVFSFNHPKGSCPCCEGLGFVEDIDESLLLDRDKSLNEGAIRFVSFGVDTWRWKRYVYSGLFDNHKKVRDYTPQELDLLLHAPQQKVPNPPARWPKTALYEGLVPRIKRSILHQKEADHHREQIAQLVTRIPCPCCGGLRLNEEVLSCRIGGLHIAQFTALSVDGGIAFLEGLDPGPFRDLTEALLARLRTLSGIGLGYLSLDRPTTTLSGGEAARVKLAKFLGSSLSDLVYVMDEPSAGLHAYDIELVKRAVLRLKERGNTVLLVEHHRDFFDIADLVVELGPGAGEKGGEITFQGTPSELRGSETATGRVLREGAAFRRPGREPKGFLEVRAGGRHNLKGVDARFPLGCLTVVSGVAGSGKSSLVEELMRQNPDRPFTVMEQGAVGVQSRSTPATYLGFADALRDLFAARTGQSKGLFSFNSAGACGECKGKGWIETNMAFMGTVSHPCEACGGRRFSPEACAHLYRGLSIADLYDLDVDRALDFFREEEDALAAPLRQLQEVGLGYLRLNQALPTLSGGERQRLKLAACLGGRKQIYVLDEPTSGLHLQDIRALMACFEKLLDQGNALVVVEHNLDVLRAADWVVDLGPHAGDRGGEVLYQGPPEGLVACDRSVTARYL